MALTDEDKLLLGLGGLGLLVLMRKPPKVVGAEFAGFKTELVEAPHQTTYRQRDGASAYDFRHYPLIDLTPDVDGDFTVEWFWTNTLNGGAWGSSEVWIPNSFTGLSYGVTVRLQLVDVRPGNVRGGSLAFGDPDGLFDGVWRTFHSDVQVRVVSPSGAEAATTGTLNEVFRSIGVLAVSFAGWNVETL